MDLVPFPINNLVLGRSRGDAFGTRRGERQEHCSPSCSLLIGLLGAFAVRFKIIKSGVSLARFLKRFFRNVLLFIPRIPRAEANIVKQHFAVLDIDLVGLQS